MQNINTEEIKTDINWHRPDKAVPDKKYDCDFKYQFLIYTRNGYKLCYYTNGYFISDDEENWDMDSVLYWSLLPVADGGIVTKKILAEGWNT